MMITVAELEQIIAETPEGKRVVYENREIGSTEIIAGKLAELRASRIEDPHYVIFVGIDRFGDCILTPFPTIGDPLEFRARHNMKSYLKTSGSPEIIPRVADDSGER
jgi:hypothetical protein